MKRKEIDVQALETLWIFQEFEAVNITSAEQAREVIEAIRNASKELRWEV